MNDLYKINKDSLLELSKRIYEEACGGYMDLRDSVCEKFIEDFLADKDNVKKLEDTNLDSLSYSGAMDLRQAAQAGLVSSAGTWSFASAGNWDGDVGVPPYVVGVDPALETAGLVTITNNVSIPQATYNVDIVLRNPDQEMLRASNYYGNESERM
jgi:hypothetical protein